MPSLKIFSGTSHLPLAQEICKSMGVPLGKCSIHKFSNENIKVKIDESVRGDDVFVVQSSTPPVNEGIIELLIMIDALRGASAERITAVLPYFPYVRSDKKDEPRISITAKLMSKLLETAGADRVLTLNLHAPQIQGFFDIQCDHLDAGIILTDYFMKNLDLKDYVVVAPDVGSAKRAASIATRMDLPMAILDKRRSDDSENPEILNVVGDVKGKKALIFDDEVASGGSMVEVVSALTKLGVKEIRAAATHGVMCSKAPKILKDSSLKEIVFTNSIPISDEKKFKNMEILSVASLLGEAIRRIHNNESIGEVFKWTAK